MAVEDQAVLPVARNATPLKKPRAGPSKPTRTTNKTIILNKAS